MKIEEILPYMPYKLNGILTVDYREDYIDCDWADLQKFKEGTIWQLAGYADKDLSIPLGEGEFNGFLWRNENTYTCFHGNGIKPIMHSLSSLTREIKHNGKKFVPIVELAKISFPHSDNFGEWEYVELDELEKMHVIQIQYKSNNGDTFPYTQYCIPAEVKKMSYRNVQKLLEWKFDIFSLIERGEAIDINTLKP